MTKLIHSAHTLRQLREAQAKHAETCTRIVQQCIICRDVFGVQQGHQS